jgi:hypothetical protein
MTGSTVQSSSAMLDALEAPGPHPDQAEKLMVFGRLVGSWEIVARFFDEDGNVIKESPGEWHFGWVLEGRVIQDVLISPPRDARKPGQQSAEYGTTIRAYDPRIDGWRVTFVAPVYGATVNLIARAHDDEIWLEGRGQDNTLLRWTFSEFGEESVHWRGYTSRDEGRTWIHDEEIILTRRT